MNGFSVVICCYNSASKIQETLGYVFGLQRPDNADIEILVIDNNSDDNTGAVATEAEKQMNLQKLGFRVIHEPRTGLVFAREAGVTNARFDTIVFCDDDNHLSEDYLLAAKQILDSHPSVGILGGYGKPKFRIATGEWIKPFFPYMAVGPQNPEDGFVNWVYGAGMIVRAEVYETLQTKNIQLLLTGRSGKVLNSGDDAELCILARYCGYKIYYSSQLSFYHAVPVTRLRKSHYMKAPVSSIGPAFNLYIMNHLISDQNVSEKTLYLKSFTFTGRSIIYFIPRIIFGKYNFYSFFNVYRLCQQLIWLMGNRNSFKKMYGQIRRNLSFE